MTIRIGRFLLFVLVTCGGLCSAAEAADVDRDSLTPFLTQHCSDCHSGGAREGGFDLDRLEFDLSDKNPGGDDSLDEATFAQWERVYDRVRLGEMPPTDAASIIPQDRAGFVELLRKPLTQAHAAAKGTVYRRLNRREYQNTMNDIFGTNLELEGRLPEDGRSHEFDNVGASLGISMVHLQEYLAAADAVMEAAIAYSSTPPEQKTITASYAETREAETHLGKVWKKLPDGAVVFFEKFGYPTGMLRGTEVKPPGRYRIRVTGYAHQSDKPITMRVGGTSFLRGSQKPTYGYFELPPGEPTTVEFEADIEGRYMIDIDPWGIHTGGYNFRKQDINDYRGPGLAIAKVELTGPLVREFPSLGQQLLFSSFDREEVKGKNRWQASTFLLKSEDADEAVRATLLRVAEQAFRRPVLVTDIEPYLRLYQQQQAQGNSLESSLRTAVAAIFCSPDFLFLREPEGKLDDHALAARLSYFLSRSTPDKELSAAAASGRLANDPAMLLTQTRRLLAGPHREHFIIDFCDAWLNLRDIEFTSPDQTLFPEYDQFLQDSMLKETRAFLGKIIDDNLPVTNLMHSDFAILNNRLAEHYGIEGVDGPRLRPVKLPPESLRGGLLTQASILKVSANGTNTSPVVRGVWVMERILGNPPQPPPPGIPGVEPDIRGASTLRELLDKHRDLDSCRSCHATIDPPGFALECFNPIGGYRERFRSLGEGQRVDLTHQGRKVRYRLGPQVDASGQLADGRRFRNYREFRDLLAAEPETLARALTIKLLTFATGREMGFSDRPIIEEIVAKSAAEDFGVRGLIESVVMSDVFLYK